ncbi:MAG: alpha/beta hydrolase, partial [Bulleidia sp.]
ELLKEIPSSYFQRADHQGRLENLYYDTWEAFTYASHQKRIRKHAVVYLPYGYPDHGPYPVLVLMHGGWSDENTYLGTPDQPAGFRNVLDHAMETGEMAEMIVVCPTYNNLNGKDSWDYHLAIDLTDLWCQELTHDLLPAVDHMYRTYAETADSRHLRDSRAFGGFSMGSVATWRTFQHCLNEFRYFFPSSGNLTSDGEAMAEMVKQQGYGPEDFCIFAASGTDDFAYPAFAEQIAAMAREKEMFRVSRSEEDGNLWFLVKKDGIHDHRNALLYFFNAMKCIFHQEDQEKYASD